jgi:hypothetical protein
MRQGKPNLKSRRHNTCDDFGGVNTLEGLDELCLKYVTPKMTIIEMGYGLGVSCALFSHYAKIVHSIDRFAHESKYTLSRDNVLFHHGNFSKIAPKLQKLYPEKVDLVYVDGLHDYDSVCEDIKIALSLVKDSGYISGHDYDYQDVTSAVSDTLKIKPEVFSDSSWILKVDTLSHLKV